MSDLTLIDLNALSNVNGGVELSVAAPTGATSSTTTKGTLGPFGMVGSAESSTQDTNYSTCVKAAKSEGVPFEKYAAICQGVAPSGAATSAVSSALAALPGGGR